MTNPLMTMPPRRRFPEDVEDVAKAVGLLTWPSFTARITDQRAEKFYNGGWRGTKTVTADLDLLVEMLKVFLFTPGTHLVWLIGPDYEQARPDYQNIENWCRDKLLMQVTSSEAGQGPLIMTISFPGMPGIIEIATKSASHPQTLGSVGPKFILACEAGQMSEQARDRIRGRASTHNCPIIWNGTFENDEGKAQFSWFEEESKEYNLRPTARRKAYSLPIWENLGLFASCLDMIRDDPTLTAFCPDKNHGPAHSGIDPDHPAKVPGTSGVPLHPKIRELYENHRDNPTFWRKYYAGEPVGVLNPVYEWANTTPEHYLRRMPDDLRKPTYPWLRTAGGADFGTVHPSAVTIGSIDHEGNTWVRRSLIDTSGAMDWVWAQMEALSKQYHFSRADWGRDPMVKYAPTFTPGEAMSGSLFAREARVGIVNGVQQADKLFFDSADPGVVLLFGEIQRVHRKRMANGQVGYDRTEGEDMAASFEDMMAILHGTPLLKIQKRVQLRHKAVRSYARTTTQSSVA